jgi:uncharacterized protein
MERREGPRPDGFPCWLELSVADAATAATFYGRLLGWTFDRGGSDPGRPRTASIGGRAAAGIAQVVGDVAAPSAWTLYFAADDVGVRTEHALALGATPVMEPTMVAGHGRMAIVQDPAGAHFGLWQAQGHPGFGTGDAPGAMSWCELLTRDPVSAEAFYTTLLGLEGRTVEGAANRYRALARDGTSVAGILQMAVEHEGVPPHWLAYFRVEDADRAADAVRGGGGSVTDGPYDVEFGRVVKASDPFGAAFALVEPPEPR